MLWLLGQVHGMSRVFCSRRELVTVNNYLEHK